jgi:hypothetical protein
MSPGRDIPCETERLRHAVLDYGTAAYRVLAARGDEEDLRASAGVPETRASLRRCQSTVSKGA